MTYEPAVKAGTATCRRPACRCGPGKLTLADSRTSSTGVLIATYRPAGAIETGSFALEQPTDAELRRRERNTAR